MNKHTIEQCERTIRDVCAGRGCLDSCISRIRAAGRCRACRPPQSAARPRNAFKIVAALCALVALAAFSLLFGEVVCEWNGQAYVCSGFGDEIIVQPGDPYSGQDVVTNVYGCCTNCTAIPPQALSNLLLEVRSDLMDIYRSADAISQDIAESGTSVSHKLEEIDGYQNSGYLEDGRTVGLATRFNNLTSYWFTVDNDQTRVVRTYPGFNSVTFSTTQRGSALAANDAIYLYANQSEKPYLERVVTNLNSSRESCNDIIASSRSSVNLIDGILPELAKAPECSGSGGSSSNSCSQVTGRWCTEEQGEAMIDLLRDQRDYLISISNYLESVDLHLGGIYRTFMNLRGGIPAESELDQSWQDIYLSNSTGSFDYGYTNVMERIELLLYGISGVGTNDSGFTSADNPFDEGESTAQNEYDRTMAQFDDLGSSFETGGEDVQSLFDRLVRFFQAFQNLVGSVLDPGTSLVGSFSFQLSSNDFDVPSLVTSEDVGIANTLQATCRVGMSALYWIVAGIIGIKFYVWFFAKVLFFLKWAWELLNGLFS